MTNKKGGYLALGPKNFTHMQGLFFFDEAAWAPYKTIENLSINQNITGIKNFFAVTERTYEKDAFESFCMFNNSMLYSVRNYTGKVLLELDFRHMFDFDDKGRIYSIAKEGNCIVITYEKFSDDSRLNKQKTCYLAIAGAIDFEPVNTWSKQHYEWRKVRVLYLFGIKFYVQKCT
jgi:hypothetical protein